MQTVTTIGLEIASQSFRCAVLMLLAVAFVSLIRHLNGMLYGAPPAGVTVGEGADWRFGFFTVNAGLSVFRYTRYPGY